MNLVIAPILLPLLTALLALAWGRPSRARRAAVTASAVAQLGLALALGCRAWDEGVLVLLVGNWSAALGITLTVDLLSAIMLCLGAFTVLAGLLYGFVEHPVRIEHPLRLPLVQFLLMGINLAFCTGDLFNIFVAFEVMLIASYALLTLEADNWDIKQAFPYVAINLVGSTLFLCAAGLIYALVGTLNFADLAQRLPALSGDPRLGAIAVLLLLVFAIKAGLYPLFFWLPHSYPTLPTPLAAIYSGLLTKVGIYVILRLLATVLPHELTFAHTALAWASGATMLLGVLGAISRNYIRGILSFHILSQVAFMTLAIGFFTPLAITAAIFYIVHHIVVKSSLFLIGGVTACLNRSDDLAHTGNLWKLTPWLGVIFLCQALSLAGLPPLSGFWGKYLIVLVGLEQREFALVAASVVASLLTLFSMLKIWLAVYWSKRDDVPVHREDRRWSRLAAVAGALAVVSLGIGLGAEGFLRVAGRAAASALDQPGYIAAVMGARGKDNARAPAIAARPDKPAARDGFGPTDGAAR
jgi:multicomponent Na+:H+ antiporter subunit D